MQVIENCDVTDTASVAKMVESVADPLDVVINNAGYFYEPLETIETMNFEEELKMIDISVPSAPSASPPRCGTRGRSRRPGGRSP